MSIRVGSASNNTLPSNALSLACKTKDLGKVQDAIAQGARPDSNTLTLACCSRSIQIIKAVIEIGATTNKHTMKEALKTEDVEIIDLISPLCAKIDAVGTQAMAPDTLSTACKTKNPIVVHRALQNGAKPDPYTLYWTCASGDLDLFKAIAATGIQPSKLDELHGSLHLAIRRSLELKNPQFAREALTLGLKPLPQTLTYALTNPELTQELFTLLLEFGAKPDLGSLPQALESQLLFAIKHLLSLQVSYDMEAMLRVQWHTNLNFYENALQSISSAGFIFPEIYPYRYELASALAGRPTHLQQLALDAKLVSQDDFNTIFKKVATLHQEFEGLKLTFSPNGGLGTRIARERYHAEYQRVAVRYKEVESELQNLENEHKERFNKQVYSTL